MHNKSSYEKIHRCKKSALEGERRWLRFQERCLQGFSRKKHIRYQEESKNPHSSNAQCSHIHWTYTSSRHQGRWAIDCGKKSLWLFSSHCVLSLWKHINHILFLCSGFTVTKTQKKGDAEREGKSWDHQLCYIVFSCKMVLGYW